LVANFIFFSPLFIVFSVTNIGCHSPTFLRFRSSLNKELCQLLSLSGTPHPLIFFIFIFVFTPVPNYFPIQ